MRFIETEALAFDDVRLEPQESDVLSRAQDLRIKWARLDNTETLPIIASPMSTVSGAEMAKELERAGSAMAVIHRYCSIQEQVKMLVGQVTPAAAVGVSGDWIERAQELVNAGAKILCVDVAHGHHVLMKQALAKLRVLFPQIHLMAGNVATPEGYRDLSEWGADSVRVGVGSGSICTTSVQTGHGKPLFQSLLDINEWRRKESCWRTPAKQAQVIADGGIRTGGDAVKAFAAGADFIMAGSIFAGADETPGEILEENGKRFKTYSGMACYSEDTEILTLDGWKKYSQLNQATRFATLNPDGGFLEYHKASNIFQYRHTGDMIHIAGSQIDALVTKNHRLYVAKRSRVSDGYPHKYNFVMADDAYGQDWFFKRSAKWVGVHQREFTLPNSSYSFPINEWMDFFGFWLAEGCTYKGKQKKIYDTFHVSLSNTKKELVAHYAAILTKAGITASVRDRGRYAELQCCNRLLYSYLCQFGKAYEKFIPSDVKSLPPEQLNILLDSIFLGDGCKGRGAICTVSERFANDISEVALKAARAPSMYLVKRAGTSHGKFNHNFDLWYVNITEVGGETFVKATASTHRIAQYDGIVWCVEVPHNLVYIKRNGRMFWCGNSKEAQIEWRGYYGSDEGVSTRVSYKGPVAPILQSLVKQIVTGLSYSGARTVQELQEKAVIRRVSHASAIEASPHILLRQ